MTLLLYRTSESSMRCAPGGRANVSVRFAVTVYRNTGLTDKSHIAFSYQLGDLEKVPKFRGPNVPDRFGYPELFDVGNTNIDGTIIKEGSRCVPSHFNIPAILKLTNFSGAGGTTRVSTFFKAKNL